MWEGITAVRGRRILCLAVAGLACLAPAGASAAVPDGFFGIGPQEAPTQADANRMAYGGIESVRTVIPWQYVQPQAGGGFDWGYFDHAVGVAARSGMTTLPVLYSSPKWVARRPTVLPVRTARARRAWTRFLRAAVDRYGPNGDYWSEHNTLSVNPVPRRVIRRWQIWNEQNFFYFTTPASPKLYAKLLKLSHRALTARDAGAKVIAGGLFARPKPRYPQGMDATRFLDKLYDVRGVRGAFDGVALHPYAATAEVMERMVRDLRRVMRRNRDGRTGLYLTEVGWGSQANSPVSFERGLRGQAKELREAYRFLIGNRRRLEVKAVFWFTWKDAGQGRCSFCDSMGLFRKGKGFSPKPAWYAFVRFTGGKAGAPPVVTTPPPPGCPIIPLPC